MFQESFTKLDIEDVAPVLEEVNPKLDGIPLDALNTTILAYDMPFYPGYRLLDISDHAISPPLKRFVIHKPGDVVILNWTNDPVYDLNHRLPIRLSDENVAEYVRFFFSYIRGRHGRFIVVEGVDDIKWKEEPPPAARKAIGKMLDLVHVKQRSDDGKNYILEARVMFKDSLFKTDVMVNAQGDVVLTNEELLVEDMPVQDDTFGQ